MQVTRNLTILIFSCAFSLQAIAGSEEAESEGEENKPVASTGTTHGASKEVIRAMQNQKLVSTLAAYGEANDNAMAFVLAATIAKDLAAGPAAPQGDDQSKANGSTQALSSKLLSKAKEMSGSSDALAAAIAEVENSGAKGYYECYTENNFGYPFYGWSTSSRSQARRLAMDYCRAGTPWGGWCFHTGCD